jgi:hypothetical protein
MRTLLLPLLCIFLCLRVSHARDERHEISQLLLQRKFEQLDEMYKQVSAGPFVLTDFSTPLSQYFMSLTPYSQSEQWAYFEILMKQWMKKHPTSPAAVLALAQLYYYHAWEFRGTGYANSVTEEGWKQYNLLLKKSLDTLMQYSDIIQDELWYYYSVARIFSNHGENFEQAIEMYMALIERWPGFMDAYARMAFYLLPRWHGNPELLKSYIEWAAEQVDEQDSDLMYAKLMMDTAHMEQRNFISSYQPDMARINRGFDTMIDKLSRQDRDETLDYYIRTLYLTQDNEERLKSALLRRGPVAFVQAWSNRKSYWELMRKCGAEAPILAAWELEKKGELEQAEAIYQSFEPNPEMNPWLSQFYQRHQKRDLLAKREDTRYLSTPVSEVTSMNDMFSLCFIYPTIGDYEKSKEAAARFDAVRGHNLSGKLAYYQVALYEGDKEAAARARQSILDMETDRQPYLMAQKFLQNPDPELLKSFDWSKRYADHAAIAMALYLYELGRIEDAKALLEDGYFNALALITRNRCAGLYLYPPQTTANTPKTTADAQ